MIPGTFDPVRNKENDYLINRDLQRTVAFTGISGIVMQDAAVQESMGPIAARSREHLGSSDAGVALLRRIWRKSIDNVAKGKAPKQVKTSADGIIEVDSYKGFAKASEVKLGPENMPSSRGGVGLIRDASGKLVFA